MAGYQWTQTRYFVGEVDGQVAIFQGVQQGVGPFSLSSVYQETDIDLMQLTPFSRSAVEDTISAVDLIDALAIIERLQREAER